MDHEQTEARQGERKRRTAYLVAGGVLSLLLPLLGAVYLKLSETKAPAGSVDAAAVFAQREGIAGRVQPAGAPAAPAAGPAAAAAAVTKSTAAPAAIPSSESGLSMIRGGQDYYQEPQPAPAPAPAKPAPPAPAPKPIPQPKAPAPAPQPFTFAKLKPAAGFGAVKSWFSGGQQQTPAQAGQLPMPAAGGANGAPDVGALMNSMRGAGGPAAAGGVGTAPAPATPDINALLKSMQQQQGASAPGQQ